MNVNIHTTYVFPINYNMDILFTFELLFVDKQGIENASFHIMCLH